MSPNLHIDSKKIADFCGRWKVTEFSIFGSALRDDFRPNSDVDVLLAFASNARWSLFDLVEMREELTSMLGREVDIVEKGTIRNPFRRHSIMASREVLYAA